jgi:hypothetical protein
VHRGDREAITKDDLLFTDSLLLNLLMNIVNFPALFSSKQKVIEFGDKVQAEHVLGMRSKVRPKKFRFIPHN